MAPGSPRRGSASLPGEGQLPVDRERLSVVDRKWCVADQTGHRQANALGVMNTVRNRGVVAVGQDASRKQEGADNPAAIDAAVHLFRKIQFSGARVHFLQRLTVDRDFVSRG